MLAKHEVDRSQQAQAGPQVVPCQFFFEIPDGKRDEDRQGNDLLQNLELPDTHYLMPDPVRGNLQQVLEQGDTSAQQSRHDPRLVFEVLKMCIPRKRHEHVAAGQQQNCLQVRRHVRVFRMDEFGLIISQTSPVDCSVSEDQP